MEVISYMLVMIGSKVQRSRISFCRSQGSHVEVVFDGYDSNNSKIFEDLSI